tara:strand:- start:42 stop:398 length:357 start_codon:yes stop_codon:yes gene_type:complete
MYLNGEYVGYTLEDTLRPFPLKVYGETAIHEGMYLCEKYNSSKFGECLAIEDVPNFTNIRIHGMNTHEDSLGCIGLGTNRDVNNMRISNCKPALDKLLAMIDDSKPIYISIVNQIGIV